MRYNKKLIKRISLFFLLASFFFPTQNNTMPAVIFVPAAAELIVPPVIVFAKTVLAGGVFASCAYSLLPGLFSSKKDCNCKHQRNQQPPNSSNPDHSKNNVHNSSMDETVNSTNSVSQEVGLISGNNSNRCTCDCGCNFTCGCECGCRCNRAVGLEENLYEPQQKYELFENNAKHIFRDKPGHLADTPNNRKLLLDLVADETNFLGEDKHGNYWFAKVLSNGKQLWASTRGSSIRNGGLNDSIKTYNKDTGLSASSINR